MRPRRDGDIAVGKHLADLEVMNGGPFTVKGFGWTYGGNIISWDGGKLRDWTAMRAFRWLSMARGRGTVN